MGDDGVFGFRDFSAEEFDRMMHEAGEGLRERFDQFVRSFATSGDRGGWGGIFADLTRPARPEPKTTGEVGDGVWAIYTVADDGGAHVEQVYATEVEALRANRHNTDPTRKVRFLPYGIAVGVLDDADDAPTSDEAT